MTESDFDTASSQKSGRANPQHGRQRQPVNWLIQRLWGLSVVVVCILVASAVLGLFARSHWLADLCANLRIQQVIGLAATVMMTLVLRKWRWLLVQVVILAIHLPWFVPAFVSTSSSDQLGFDDADLVVMVANVYTPNQQHDQILNEIRNADPDVFAILELGTPLHQTLEREIVDDYPNRATIPQDQGNFGIAVYSRFPLKESERFVFSHETIETIAVKVQKGATSYQIIATHPLPPIGRGGFESRNEHLSQLAQRIGQTGANNPTIVAGDFNLTPWSPIMTDFETNTNLRRAGRGRGVTPTWYAKPLFPFGLMLDHVFISDGLECVGYRTGQFIGSDHRAVIVGLKRTE